MDTGYLERGLEARVSDVQKSIGQSLEVIMRRNAAAGALASGATLIMFTEESLKTFEGAYRDVLQFAYNVTGQHEPAVAEKTSASAAQMIADILAAVHDRANRTGIGGAVVPNQISVIRRDLGRLKTRLTDDFIHGMMGSERMRRDPLVNIVNNQTNSPGAVQQIGVGDHFSQSAMVQNLQPLTDAISRALASAEFAALEPAQKDAFKDTADTLVEEAKKAPPDAGKIKRWGERLGALGKEFGLSVATAEIMEILHRIFS